MDGFRGWIHDTLGLGHDAQDKLLVSAVIIVAAVLARWLVARAAGRRTEDVVALYRWRRGATYTATGLALVLLSGVWVTTFQSVGLFLGLASAGLAIALRDPIANLAGWAFIVWRRPFDVGDRVKMKRVLAEIAERHSLHLSQQAEESLRAASRRFMIFYTHLTPTVYTDVVDHGVRLTARYLVDPRARRGSTQAVWEDVLRVIAAEPDSDLAYPTQRFYTAPAGPPPASSGTTLSPCSPAGRPSRGPSWAGPA